MYYMDVFPHFGLQKTAPHVSKHFFVQICSLYLNEEILQLFLNDIKKYLILSNFYTFLCLKCTNLIFAQTIILPDNSCCCVLLTVVCVFVSDRPFFFFFLAMVLAVRIWLMNMHIPLASAASLYEPTWTTPVRLVVLNFDIY